MQDIYVSDEEKENSIKYFLKTRKYDLNILINTFKNLKEEQIDLYLCESYVTIFDPHINDGKEWMVNPFKYKNCDNKFYCVAVDSEESRAVLLCEQHFLLFQSNKFHRIYYKQNLNSFTSLSTLI